MQIENEFLRANVKAEGAELTSVLDKVHSREMLWTADPAVWFRHAPVLFPFVGRCHDDKFRYQGKTYDMPKHGFAKDSVFSLENASSTSLTFSLSASEETRKVYPFDFTLQVSYSLLGPRLVVSYLVRNDSPDGPMYFSIGGHPGFLYSGLLKDQIIVFNERETLDRLPIDPETSYMRRELDQAFIRNGSPIHLTENTYVPTALVFQNFQSSMVELKNEKTGRGVRFHLGKFPYLGLWSVPGAPYTCIEPWFGINDYEDFHGEIPEKDGIQKLGPGGLFHCRFAFEGL